MLSYAMTILIGSTLLFLIEPMIARFILPWFGGGPSVWSSCMLFFQAFLLGGYAYAHWIGTRLKPRRQALVHLALLALSLLLLPVTPGEEWKPQNPNHPELRIILLLVATIGLPFALLASTSPLQQYWFSRACPGRSPYRLYALSNAGSVLGLLLYPFLLEPRLTLRGQTVIWSVAYGAFVVASGWCALRLARQGAGEGSASEVGHDDANEPDAQDARSGWWGPVMWVLLSACGSVMLLATTNQMCQEVAVIPFLWIVPLALYLFSFIICFEYERLSHRAVWGGVLCAALGGLVWMFERTESVHVLVQLGVLSALLFACCMVCHGELVRLKPPARRLTSFYLMVSLGGALGGLFVNFVAPHIFSGLWEFHIGIALTFIFLGVLMIRSQAPLKARWWEWGLRLAWLAGLLALGYYLRKDIDKRFGGAIAASRNFYGVLNVTESGTGTEAIRTLKHGPIEHGNQYLDPARRAIPTTYYSPDSGIAVACAQFPRRAEGVGLNIGVVGLGTGTSACLGRRGDRIRFYEINPEILRIAKNYFYYLNDCPAKNEVVLGDARISLERELKEKPRDGNGFDVLALDAFNGDAIPVHLLTRESFELYWRHLRPDGILALNISNLHLDLAPVVAGLARETGKTMVMISNDEDLEKNAYATDWALVTDNAAFLNNPEVRAAVNADATPQREIVWTDQYSNILQILRPFDWRSLWPGPASEDQEEIDAEEEDPPATDDVNVAEE